jgi:type I restriction enzyme M protein
MRKSGKDNSGDKIWRKISSSTASPPDDELSDLMPPSPVQRVVGVESDFLRDNHEHLVVDHDLYNHEGKTEDGIAEAFIEFAKKENFSFFELSPSVAPFDAVKYQRLMDGLEAVEVNIKKALISNDKFRLDSDFFRKDYTAKLNMVINQPFKPIGEISYITDGEHGTVETNENGYSKYYGARNVLGGILDDNSVEYISEEVHFRNRRSILQPNDVLISCVGANIGCAAIVPDNIGIANIVRNVALIRSTNSSFSNFYILAYFFSKYGKDLYRRNSTGNAQPLVILDNIKSLPVPIFGLDFQLSISNLIQSAKKALSDSKDIYQQAEDLLLSELGLKDWQPTEENVALKSFAESFLSSGRLDSEHYKPKYDQAVEKINSLNPIEIINLEDILIDITNGHTPLRHDLSIGDVKFLTAEHIHDFKINYETQKRILISHHQTELKRTHLNNGDILITIKGRVGNAAVVENLNQLVNINQDVALLRLKFGFNPYYLVGFFNSQLGKLLIKKASTGQINPFLSLGALRKLSIPIFAESRMQELGILIKSKVEDFHQAELKSKQLLEIAKTGVEQAIETDEATATIWINQQLEALGVKLT